MPDFKCEECGGDVCCYRVEGRMLCTKCRAEYWRRRT